MVQKTDSTKGNLVKCSNCGLNILDHVKTTFISCLSTLSGEIEVYRECNKERLSN